MESEVIFVSGPISVPAKTLVSREVGAVMEFHGVVREIEGGGKIGGLFYEAYEPMARREFDRIIAELSTQHPIQSVLVIHRLGDVRVGEASLFVRGEAKRLPEWTLTESAELLIEAQLTTQAEIASLVATLSAFAAQDGTAIGMARMMQVAATK